MGDEKIGMKGFSLLTISGSDRSLSTPNLILPLCKRLVERITNQVQTLKPWIVKFINIAWHSVSSKLQARLVELLLFFTFGLGGYVFIWLTLAALTRDTPWIYAVWFAFVSQPVWVSLLVLRVHDYLAGKDERKPRKLTRKTRNKR